MREERSMTDLDVSYDQMQSAAGRLRAGQDELAATLQQLRELVGQLVADGFTTTAASGAFQLAYEQFTQGALQAVSGLDAMSQFLERAAQTLAEVDSRLAAQLAG